MLIQNQLVAQSRRGFLRPLSMLVGLIALLTPMQAFAQKTSPVEKINAEAAKADITVQQ